MSALNFKEIPEAHTGPDRDRFEIFAREFFAAKKFRIVEHPDRGPDGGRDLILEEDRSGPGGTTIIRWLVSCKHKAHGTSSVQPPDDSNIRDRLGTHGCQGFISFYSAVPSSGLANILNGLKPTFEYLPFDPGSIERFLLDTPEGRSVAARFMPISFGEYMERTRQAAKTAPFEERTGLLQYFIREPHTELEKAKDEAGARGLPIIAVIYDPDHPSWGKFAYSLGYFMEFNLTKRLVDEHFVTLVGPSSDASLQELVPETDPLEQCLMVILYPDGSVLDKRGAAANPESGLALVRNWIKMVEKRTSTAST